MKKIIYVCLFGFTLLIMVGCGAKKNEAYFELLETSQQMISRDYNYSGAEKVIAEAIEMEAEMPEAYIQAGYLHLIQGEYNQANDMLVKGLRYEKNFQEEESRYLAYLNMGNLKYQQKQLEVSLEYLLRALEIRQDDPALYNALGLVYVALGDLEQGIEQYNQALEVDTGYFYTYGNLAVAYQKKGEYLRALNEINTALALNDNIPYFYTIKGDIERENGNLEESIEILSEAILRWDTYGDAYFKRGEAYLQQGEYLKAIEDFAYGRDAGIDEAILGMGYAYQGLKQYEDAIDAFQFYIEKKKGIIDLRALFEIAMSYYQLEQYDKVIDVLDQLLDYEPEDVEAMLLQVYAYEKMEDYLNASQRLTEILEIDPENKAAQKELDFIEKNNFEKE